MQSNPQILELLTEGATITFPDGFYIKGLPETRDLEVGFESGSMGLWTLSLQGITFAMDDIDQARQDIKQPDLEYIFENS